MGVNVINCELHALKFITHRISPTLVAIFYFRTPFARHYASNLIGLEQEKNNITIIMVSSICSLVVGSATCQPFDGFLDMIRCAIYAKLLSLRVRNSMMVHQQVVWLLFTRCIRGRGCCCCLSLMQHIIIITAMETEHVYFSISFYFLAQIENWDSPRMNKWRAQVQLLCRAAGFYYMDIIKWPLIIEWQSNYATCWSLVSVPVPD